MKQSAEKKRKATFCLDCVEDPKTCGKDPIACMEEAHLYFRLYDKSRLGKFTSNKGVVA